MSDTTDEAWLALASVEQQRQSARSSPGLDQLSRKYRSVLIRYFQRRGIQAADAQDLAQEVFYRLARQDGLDAVETIETYLFATAANAARDAFRRAKVRLQCPSSNVVEALQIAEELSPERQLADREELECVLAALNEMPERMRTIFILARLENMPRAEIAARLGISKSTVEQSITAATACLADRRRRIS